MSFGVDPASGRRLRRKVRGQTQASVAKKLRALELERDAGVRRPRSWTVATWLEEWIAGRELQVRRTTVHGYRADVRHIVRTLGRTRIDRLTAEQVEAMYRDCLAAGLSAGSISHIRRTLSAAMTAAVNRGYLLRNPVRLAACPVYELPDVEPYDADQSRRARRGDLHGPQRCAVADPTRAGPAPGRGARTRVDRPRPRRRLGRHHASTSAPAARAWLPHRCRRAGSPPPAPARMRHGGGLHRVPVKSKASRRRLKLPDELLVQLRRTRLHQRQERLRAGNKWSGGDWVFTDELGRPYGAKRDLRAVVRTVRSSPACPANAPTTCATPVPPCSCRPAWPTRWSVGHSDIQMCG